MHIFRRKATWSDKPWNKSFGFCPSVFIKGATSKFHLSFMENLANREVFPNVFLSLKLIVEQAFMAFPCDQSNKQFNILTISLHRTSIVSVKFLYSN